MWKIQKSVWKGEENCGWRIAERREGEIWENLEHQRSSREGEGMRNGQSGVMRNEEMHRKVDCEFPV